MDYDELALSETLPRLVFQNTNYEVVHMEGTRESNFCALGSMLGTHGTTLLVVIAKKNLVKSHSDFHVNDHCSASFPENNEKGFASITLHLLNGKSVALAAAHLESSDSKIRRESFIYFFQDAYKNGWNSCNYQFIFGDFNVRTGDNNSKEYQDTECISSTKIQVKSLRIWDELTGINPYSTDPSWKGNILSYINKLQLSIFREGDLNFLPTYSIKPSEECDDHEMCYRADRPVSWTDRILYTKGEIVKYDSILEKYGDHYPVFGIYKLN